MSDSPMIQLRLKMIKMALEADMKGFRLTRKAPPPFRMIKDEFGIKAKRGPEGKRAAYEEFCKKFGFEPKAAPAPAAPPAPPAPVTPESGS